MRKLVMWFPVLMVGAMVYWTLAFSFGGLSLMGIGGFRDPDALDDDGPSAKDTYQSITVNLAGAPDPQGQGQAEGCSRGQFQDLQDLIDQTIPSSVTVDLISDHESSRGSGRESGGDERGQGDRGGSARVDHGPGDTAF